MFAALIIFYIIRAIHLNIVKLEFPSNYYWEDPNIPSIVVKYGLFSDFFYSVIIYVNFKGHVGYLVICGLEMKKIGKPIISILFFVCSLF